MFGFIIGLVIGGIVGFMGCALLVMERRQELEK